MRNKVLVVLVTLSIATAYTAPADAGSPFRSAVKSLNKRHLRESVRTVNGRALSQAEWQALQRSLSQLDAAMLARIKRQYGDFIPASRWKTARDCRVCYLDAREMDAYLARRHPKLSAEDRRQILGLYERDREAILIQTTRSQSRLPSTVSHERLHQLSDPRFDRSVGGGLAEGTTEYFTQRISRDIPLGGRGNIYPNERDAIERLAARVGDERLARAYFSGEVGQLARAVDAELGSGAFAALVKRAQKEDWVSVNAILRSGI